jgi:hypothetical protein
MTSTFTQQAPGYRIYFNKDLDLTGGTTDPMRVAIALSRIPRFCGNTDVPYTVADHLVNFIQLLPPAHQTAWLFHEYAEAFIGDVPGPIKTNADKLCHLENQILNRVAKDFASLGLDRGFQRGPHVKTIDEFALYVEARTLWSQPPTWVPLAFSDYEFKLSNDTPAFLLQQLFIEAFYGDKDYSRIIKQHYARRRTAPLGLQWSRLRGDHAGIRSLAPITNSAFPDR